MIGFLRWIVMMCVLMIGFLKQINIVNSDSNIDILGGNILCFETFPIFSAKTVPITYKKILRFMKYRNSC